MKLVETTPLPDREPPEGGWKPVCKVEDHTFKVRCEGGSVVLECLDAHTQEQIEEMEPNGCLPGCDIGAEWLIAEFGSFKLRWEKESGGWEYPNDYDAWVEIAE